MVLFFRWVDENLTAHEDFVGLHVTYSITSAALVAIIQDTLLRMNLKVQHCRGGCYDGASVMTGCCKGVAKIINDDESGAIYTHCYGRTLILSAGDTIRQCQVMKAAMDVVADISELLEISPKRDAVFKKIKAELAPDYARFRVLCPTRWTVRAASLQSVLNNYEVLLSAWEEAQAWKLDGEMQWRIPKFTKRGSNMNININL